MTDITLGQLIPGASRIQRPDPRTTLMPRPA